jgi:hypothetical protein
LLAVTSLAAIALAPIPAQAISFTLGNNTGSISGQVSAFTGQSFTPNVGGNAADANFTTVLTSNPSQVYLNNFTFIGFTSSAPTQLNIYANSDRTGLVTSSTSNSGFSYTFNGLTPLNFGTQYYAFYPNDENNVEGILEIPTQYSGGETYLGGFRTGGIGTNFTATLDPTPVPFDFEPTGAVVILGGLWGLKRWVKKKRQG